MVVRTEELGDLGIVHAPADLLAQELAQELVRGGILEDVPVGRVEAESADRVALLELALALLGRRLPDALRARVPGVPGRGRASQAAEGAVALLALRLTASAASGPFQAGTLKFAVRWNTVRCAASCAMIGMAWTAEEPVPITPTRLPATSTPSCGHRPVWCSSPANRSRPGRSGIRGTERHPVAMIRKVAERRSPSPVTIDQDPAGSSSAASATRVPSRMSRRRSKRSATCSR